MRPPCGRRIPRSRGSGCYARAGRCCGLPCAEWYCGPLVQSVQACGVRIGEDLQDFLLQEISLGTLSAYIAHTCFTPLPEDGRTCIGFISAEELYTLLEWKISHWLLSLRICIPLAYRASSADVRNFFVGIEEGDGTKNSARITLLEREITQLPEFQGWEQPVCRLFHGVLFVVHNQRVDENFHCTCGLLSHGETDSFAGNLMEYRPHLVLHPALQRYKVRVSPLCALGMRHERNHVPRWIADTGNGKSGSVGSGNRILGDIALRIAVRESDLVVLPKFVYEAGILCNETPFSVRDRQRHNAFPVRSRAAVPRACWYDEDPLVQESHRFPVHNITGKTHLELISKWYEPALHEDLCAVAVPDHGLTLLRF